ncbi:MAG: hypothetical protein HQ582_24140 [Planctomycetes bacterium]|nr:hypothetical protein [Planctomycetota bacterium]
MKTGIQDWLNRDARPADLYELLGRERFDPDRQGLLAAVRAAYAELHPFENHKDPKVARRAVELLGELGRAEDVFSDSEKLRAYHESILGGFPETQAVEPVAEEEPTEAFQLQEREPVETGPDPMLEPVDGPPPRAPSAEPQATELPDVLLPLPETGPKRQSRGRRPRRKPGRGPQGAFAKLAGGRPRWQWALVIAAAGLAWVLLLFAVWVMFAVPDEWQGQLARIRGHDGEIHLLVRLDPTSSAGQASFVEAIVQDDRFGREISDYQSDDDATTGGDHVVVEGRRCKPDRARFRLTEPSQATLVELAAIQRVDETRSRAVVGFERRRASFDSDRRLGVLARLIRIHPQPGESIGFAARYGGFGQRGVELHPSPTDQRIAWVEFAGASEADFSLYQPGDEVYAVATLCSESSTDSLILTGISIRRLQEPNSPVSATGAGG